MSSFGKFFRSACRIGAATAAAYAVKSAGGADEAMWLTALAVYLGISALTPPEWL